MCGRYTLRTPAAEVARHFGLPLLQHLEPRYNIAPTQEVPVVRLAETGQRELVAMRWGLVPSWSQEGRPDARTINARSETAHEKPAFRGPFRRRRCLVPADGFYEWAALAGHKQPYYITFPDGRVFAMAGLWDHWSDGQQELDSFAILTTSANQRLRPLHERMPVILAPEDYPLWLGERPATLDECRAVLRPAPDEWLQFVAVTPRVNRPSADDPHCIDPLGPPNELLRT
jgi:putative SOS response-associated peptidase YedK